MCFYFQLTSDAQTLENRFQRKFLEKSFYKPKEIINGFEHPSVPVILLNKFEFEFFEWGVIPAWSKDRKIQNLTLNARIETLSEKPSFKNILSNRCLVPANGFFEWQWLDEKGKEKQRFLIQTESQNLFTFAGLTSLWVDGTSGEFINTFSIVTTQASPMMSQIHNTKKRMPVILKEEDEMKWLKGVDVKQFAFPYERLMQAMKI